MVRAPMAPPAARPCSVSLGSRAARRGALVALAPVALALCGAFGAWVEPACAQAVSPKLGPYPTCGANSSDKQIEAAKGSHAAAKAFFEKKDFERAIRSWREAYEFDCSAHKLLRNIAEAYEELGDVPEAILAIRTYAERIRGRDASEESFARTRLAELEAKASVVPPPVTASAPPKPTASSSVAPSASPASPRPYGATPLVVVGVGATLTVAGLVLFPLGLVDITEADRLCIQGVCPSTAIADQGNRGNALAITGGVTLGLGLAGLVGGLAWQLVANRPSPATKPSRTAPKSAWVLPAVGVSHTGLTVGGTF
jgi:hypothetical protein